MEQHVLVTLIQKVIALQEERLYTCDLFNEGHKIYLSTAPNYDLDKLKQLMLDVTAELKRISSLIGRIEAKIRPHQPELADLIAGLEKRERRNLQIVAKLQLARQDQKSHPRDETKGKTVVAIKEQLQKNEAQIGDLVKLIRKYKAEFIRTDLSQFNEVLLGAE